MGIIFSKFRKKKTTIEILDDLDRKMKLIEQYGENTEQRHKKIVGTLIIYSVVLYIVSAIVFYFYFFPAELYDQLFYITPLLIFPILILFTKKTVTWYYKRKLSKNEEKLKSMKKEKEKILDNVTETETYKKAKEILIKFAPDQLQASPFQKTRVTTALETPKSKESYSAIRSAQQTGELRRRVLATSANIQNLSLNKTIVGEGQTDLPQTPLTTTAFTNDPLLPRPILPQQRSYIDRLVEYIVGDGPSNRYALICRQCDSHNGMALQEEFEYFAFRCCYCNFWNPARKQKPSAPKLEFTKDALTPQRLLLRHQKSTDSLVKASATQSVSSVTHSDTDSDKEIEQKFHLITANDEEKNTVNADEEANTINVDEEENAANADDNSDVKDTGLINSLSGSENQRSQSDEMEVDESPPV